MALSNTEADGLNSPAQLHGPGAVPRAQPAGQGPVLRRTVVPRLVGGESRVGMDQHQAQGLGTHSHRHTTSVARPTTPFDHA